LALHLFTSGELILSRLPFAFWLIPASPAYESFAEIIRDLARQYEAVPFEPHVTFFVGENHPQETLLRLGAELAQTHPPLTLTGQVVNFSASFFKTVFVAFFDDPILTSLYRQTAVALDDHAYRLDPHMSLIYKNTAVSTKKKIIQSLKYELSTVPFDTIKLVFPNPETGDFADIGGWRIVHSWKLGEGGDG